MYWSNTMPLHSSTFEYLKPTDTQIEQMAFVRQATKDYAATLEKMLPNGSDKAYIMRKVREVGMWANVCITRQVDGTPRTDTEWPGP